MPKKAAKLQRERRPKATAISPGRLAQPTARLPRRLARGLVGGNARWAPQPSAEGAGKPLFGALLKAKPQRSLLVFENRELKDGSVYVNITPKSKQLFEDEE